MASWRVANGLLTLRSQLMAEVPGAAPPRTPWSSWGTIADAAHSSTSDHSPKDFGGWDDNVVTAADIPHAPSLGLDFGRLAEALRRSKDPRIKYVIFNGRMFSSYSSGGYPAWSWRPYLGSDQHRTHGHVSVVGDRRADGTAPWDTSYGGDDMALTDEDARKVAKALLGTKVAGTGSAPGNHDRTVGDILKDAANMRSVLVGETPTDAAGVLPEGSPLALLLGLAALPAASAEIEPVQVTGTLMFGTSAGRE